MTVASEVLAIAAAWDAALVRNDAEAVASFMADDWAYVGPTGATPKADIISWIASGQLAHHTMETIGAARVSAHGNTAVVTSRKTEHRRLEQRFLRRRRMDHRSLHPHQRPLALPPQPQVPRRPVTRTRPPEPQVPGRTVARARPLAAVSLSR
jgi:hypothetical protein